MKKLSSRRKTGALLLVVLSGLLTILLFQISAASGTLTLTPSTKTVTQGKTFTTTVTANTDGPIPVAKVVISYNKDQLLLSKIDYSGAPLDLNVPESSNTPGSLVIARYKLGEPYPSGKFTIATLTFTAKATGNAAITIDQSKSLLYEASEGTPNVLTQVSSTSISVNTPPATSPKPVDQPPSPTSGKPSSGGQARTSSPTGSTNTSSNSTSSTPSSNQSDTGSTVVEDDTVPVALIEEQPAGTLPEPGTSRNASDPSLATQIIQFGKNALPIVLLLGIAGAVGWFITKRSSNHSSFGGYKPAQAAGPGVVFDGSRTVKTNQDNNTQPPSPVQ